MSFAYTVVAHVGNHEIRWDIDDDYIGRLDGEYTNGQQREAVLAAMADLFNGVGYALSSALSDLPYVEMLEFIANATRIIDRLSEMSNTAVTDFKLAHRH